MSPWTQDSPFSLQVEATEGCSLFCSFCGLRGIRSGAKTMYKFMDLGTADTVARQVAALGWDPRIEWAVHGEPTLNADLPELVGAFRRHLPGSQIMVTTNGTPLVHGAFGYPDFESSVDALFRAGVNIIALDDYRTVTVADDHARRYLREDVRVGDYPADKSFNPHQRVRPGTRMLSIVADIEGASDGTHSKLGNHAGSAGPKDISCAGKRCAKPFREMSVRWDGNVAICCNDWRGTFKVGNVNVEGVEAIWQHPRMMAARRKLYCGERDFGPCNGCSHTSYRVGLLPDRKGKVDPGPVEELDLVEIAEALAGDPYTAPVLRKWEKATDDPTRKKAEPAVVDGHVVILKG